MKEKIKKILQEGRVDVFLGYRLIHGHPLPYFYSADRLEDLNELVTGPIRYPLEKMALEKVRQNPAVRIGLLARDCNRRALNVLFAANQMDPAQIETIDLTCCPSNLKSKADCSHLQPGKSGKVKIEIGIDNHMALDDLEALPPEERLSRWQYEFEKCIKCYGCRDICPVCYCAECSLEHPELVKPGRLPVEIPIFHLVRAVHMAGRCIDCGLCEEACPVDIPLRLLYGKVNEIMGRVFDYRAGEGTEMPPFSTLDVEKSEEKTADRAA